MIEIRDARAMRACGTRVGERARAGDVIELSGELGAGKTTWVQGLAEGLGVRGPITSPTFVIARRHPSTGNGPALLHVDAYRVGSRLEFDDLDLDVGDAVVAVEWGEGMAELLGGDRLIIRIERGDDDVRRVEVTQAGERWDLAELLG